MVFLGQYFLKLSSTCSESTFQAIIVDIGTCHKMRQKTDCLSLYRLRMVKLCSRGNKVAISETEGETRTIGAISYIPPSMQHQSQGWSEPEEISSPSLLQRGGT